jgi:hypothetical protein
MDGPLWKFLNAASSFDLITPLAAFIQDVANGSPAHFGISPYTGLRFRHIRRLLKRHGVKVWGLMLSPDAQTVMFTVHRSQARWTYYLLQREGIPILYAPEAAVRDPDSHTNTPSGGKNPLEPVIRLLDKLDNQA